MPRYVFVAAGVADVENGTFFANFGSEPMILQACAGGDFLPIIKEIDQDKRKWMNTECGFSDCFT